MTISGTTTFTDTYVYSQHGMPLELLCTTPSGTTRYWYLRDGLGNVVALTDVNGNVVDQYAYDLWGKPTTVSETVPQQLRYQGYWYDNEVGWYWLSSRSYDPTLERFLQPDPSEQDGLFSYAYVGDDPVDLSDPSGFGVGSCVGGPGSGYCVYQNERTCHKAYCGPPMTAQDRAVAQIALGVAILVGCFFVCAPAATVVIAAGEVAVTTDAAEVVTQEAKELPQALDHSPPAGGCGCTIPGLRPAEQASLTRLEQLPKFADRAFSAAPTPEVDWVDDEGKTYDQIGNPQASQHWAYQERNFLGQISDHIAKADYTVLDMTGFTQSQIDTVRQYVDGLPQADQDKIVRLGF